MHVTHFYLIFRAEDFSNPEFWTQFLQSIIQGCEFESPRYSSEGWKGNKANWKDYLDAELFHESGVVTSGSALGRSYVDVDSTTGKILMSWNNSPHFEHWMDVSIRRPSASKWIEQNFLNVCRLLAADYAVIYSNEKMDPTHEIEFGWKTYLSRDYAIHAGVNPESLNKINDITWIEDDGAYVIEVKESLHESNVAVTNLRLNVRQTLGGKFFGEFAKAKRLSVKRKQIRENSYSTYDMYGKPHEFIRDVPQLLKQFEELHKEKGSISLQSLSAFNDSIRDDDLRFLEKKRIALAVMGELLIKQHGGEWAINGIFRKQPVIKTEGGTFEPWRSLEEV